MGFTISNEAEKFALANTKKLTGLHGRWDVIGEHPAIVLDVAHNEDGIVQMLAQLSLISDQFDNLHIVTGMVKDKDIDKILSLLPKEAAYYFTNAHIPRALSATDLQEKANEFHLFGNQYEDVNEALKAAKQQAGINDLILVCGSIFLVGEVELNNNSQSGNDC
jgi:dihydrofolate synthase/folylpolyglutamate synthase